MIIHCSNCATRLQLDDAKIPARPFTVKCPKCQAPINAQPPAVAAVTVAHDSGAHAATKNNGHEASEPVSFEMATPAPASKVESVNTNETKESAPGHDRNGAAASETSELVRVLSALLERGSPAPDKQRSASRLAWERRRTLVCVAGEDQRDAVAQSLAGHEYQTFVANDVTQALERMREERMDVVILDPDFDAVEQGAAFITREVGVLRPAERRRLFLVRLHATTRTGDPHAAFIANVNLIVNTADIEKLPRALERAMRDYNDLYHDLNRALNVAAL